MPNDYEWGVLFHVLGVFALAGGMALSFGTFTMMRHARTVQELRVWGTIGRILGQYHVMPLISLELLLSGAYLVDKLELEWSDGWIIFSLIALVLAVANGYLVIGPRQRAIGAAAGPAPDGPVPPRIGDMLNDPILLGTMHANIMVTFGIIWNMIAKPDDAASLLVLVLFAALGAASAAPSYARARSAP
jgi:uncharacterized membrane protein